MLQVGYMLYIEYERGVAIMIPNGKQYKVWFLLTVISLLIAGCAPSPEEALDNVSLEEHNPKSGLRPNYRLIVILTMICQCRHLIIQNMERKWTTTLH